MPVSGEIATPARSTGKTLHDMLGPWHPRDRRRLREQLEKVKRLEAQGRQASANARFY